jgi:hypothetical protein
VKEMPIKIYCVIHGTSDRVSIEKFFEFYNKLHTGYIKKNEFNINKHLHENTDVSINDIRSFEPEVFLTAFDQWSTMDFLHANFPNKPIFCLDHGPTVCKWFISPRSERNDVIYLTTSHIYQRLFEHKKEMNRYNTIVGCGYIDKLTSPPQMTKTEFCAKYGFDKEKPLILYAPTWINKTETDLSDYNMILEQLSKIPNTFVIQHQFQQRLPKDKIKYIKNDRVVSFEALKHCDIMITDTSSVNVEATRLKKPVIQMMMRKYSDGRANLPYTIPHIPIIDQPFVGGWLSCSDTLTTTIEDILKDGGMKMYQDNIGVYNEKMAEATGIMIDGVEKKIYKAIHSIYTDITTDEEHKTYLPITREEYQNWFGYPSVIYKKTEQDFIKMIVGEFDDEDILENLEDMKEGSTRFIVGIRWNKVKETEQEINQRIDKLRQIYGFINYIFRYDGDELKLHYKLLYQVDSFIECD